MTSGRRAAVVKILWWIVAPVALLALLRPWTTRPIEGVKPEAFEAGSFAASTWPRLAREAAQTAADLAEIAVPGSTAAAARFVKGTGVVSSVDRQSQAGVLRVQLAGSPKTTSVTVAVQIGPVVRGTALRDAAGFIHFSDFTNQFDYASAAGALNEYALRTVVAPLPVDTLQGHTVAFIGAVGRSAAREDGAIEVVPVHLEIVQAAAK